MYVQSDTLLLADVFEKFRNMCLKIYELDHAKFLLASRWAWQAALKVKLDLLKLVVVKDIKGGIWHSIYRYVKASNNCMKGFNKNKEL